MDTSQITQTILSTINTLFGNMVSSIDNQVYSVLDDLIFITTDFLKDNQFENLFGTSTTSGILLLSNAFLLGFILYYILKHFLSIISLTSSPSPYQFIFKLIIFGICMNGSFFICEQIISIVSIISSAICSLGEDLFNTSISFSSLIEKLNTVIYIEEANINLFSVDGIIKIMISTGFLTLIFSYSIRYILLKVLILFSPFAILCLSLPSTSSIFKIWIKNFLSLLFLQIFVALILIVIFSLNFDSSNILSKFIFVGSIFVLIRANSYIREIFGGISLDVQGTMQNLQGLFRR